MAKNRKIKKYKKRRRININIGTVIFGVIFIYILMFGIIRYFFTPHITMYEVSKSSISDNTVYTGLALRSEQIVNAESSGTVSYYVGEGERVSTTTPVYTIDATGTLSQALQKLSEENSTLSDDELSKIKKKISLFQNTYSDSSFNKVYDFKNEIDRSILEALNINSLKSLMESEGFSADSFSVQYSPTPGILVLSYDGYEDITEDNFTKEQFNTSKLKKKALKSGETIQNGNVAYKLITSEKWDIAVPIDDNVAKDLSEGSSIQITFQDDNVTTWVTYSIKKKDNDNYLILNLQNFVLRYASERYIDLELNLDCIDGLKIPTTAILKEDFYTIPVEYITNGGNSSNDGFLLEVYDDKGNSSTKFKETQIYYKDKKYYYVSASEFEAGDNIIKPKSSDKYQIGKKEELTGVYNIDKGYAEFCYIDIIYKTDDFCIVKEGLDYSLIQYDHIALDSSCVDEDDII